jgi:hypothetical protein
MKYILLLSVWLLCGNAYADIIYLDEIIDLQGTGVGATDPIIRLQSQGAGDVETGCVGVNGGGSATNTGCGFTNDNVQQSNLIALDTLGLGNGSEFRIVFNGIEPEGNDGEAITIDELQIVLYSSTGTVLETFNLQSPVTIPDTIQGQGQAGFLFALDTTQAGLLSNRLGSGALIGGGGQFSDAQGGPDSIFLYRVESDQPDIVPEPSTWALMAIGIPLLVAARRRKLVK